MRDASAARLTPTTPASSWRSHLVPHYEYVCANGHRTEVVHGMHDPGPTVCPVCGAPMRKAFVAPTVMYKGSGWAKMDRRSPRAANKAAGEGSSDSAAAGSEGAGEAKPKPDTSTSATSSTDSSSDTAKPAKKADTSTD
jgi:putative FmdB family regulatory protein